MLKLLIADDEESIRNGLKCIVDWEALGFTLCTEASNGNEAVQAIKDYSPDLVLLDIKMPGLTGIEVMESVNEYAKSQGTNVPAFLILSGFSQFEYAQKALNLGAKGYLLKPVDEDELTEKVRLISNEINREQNIQKESQTAKKVETREFYKNILKTGKTDCEEDSDDGFTVLIISFEYFPDADKSLIEKSVENYFSYFSRIDFSFDGNTVLVLKNANSEAVYNCIDRFVKRYPECTFITLGKKLKGYQGLLDSYKEAESYLKYLFFVSDTGVIEEKTVISIKEKADKSGNALSGNFSESAMLDKILFCIETYDKKNLIECENDFENYIYSLEPNPAIVRQKIITCLMGLKNKLVAKYPEREEDDDKSIDIIPPILMAKNFQGLLGYFKNVLNVTIENFNTNTADSVIVKVIAYIKTNYASDLKLENLGDLFNCNSAYLGKKFKKTTGVQFNTYLDNLRIEEAKNKLLNTDLKIYQISKLVGYANTDYFFMKFKKATGMTPKEFKENIKNE